MTANSVDQQVGRRAKHFRTKAAKSAANAANSCGLSVSDYEAAERGERRLLAIELTKLAQELKVDIAEFFKDFGQVDVELSEKKTKSCR